MGLTKQSAASWERDFRAQVRSQVSSGASVVVAELRDKKGTAARAHLPDALRIMTEYGYQLRQTDNLARGGVTFNRITVALLTFELVSAPAGQ